MNKTQGLNETNPDFLSSFNGESHLPLAEVMVAPVAVNLELVEWYTSESTDFFLPYSPCNKESNTGSIISLCDVVSGWYSVAL